MTKVDNPALEAFVKQLGDTLEFAQVLIRREGAGFELRHVTDRDCVPEALKLVTVSELRELAQYSASGAFRPLKSAPNLRRGWRVAASNSTELDAALGRLYPGGIADWFAVPRQDATPITNYREFTERQTGMYRITTMLTDAQAADAIRAGCHRRFCLKRRLWTVAGLKPDAAGEKSILPCLEPCPVLLEFARTAMRIEQEGTSAPPADIEAAAATLEAALARPNPNLREADFSSEENPRRQQLALEKINRLRKPPQQ